MDRKERDKYRRKKEIISVAYKLFMKKGYDHVSLDEIAKKAEFTKRTVYNYFTSKPDLFLHAYMIMVKMHRKHYDKLIEEAESGLDKFRVYGIERFRTYNKHFGFFTLDDYFYIIEENKSIISTEALEDFYSEKTYFLNRLSDIFRIGMIDGSFSSDLDIDSACQFYMSTILSLMKNAIVTADTTIDRETNFSKLFEMLLKAFR